MTDITALSMTEIIRLQNDLSQELKRRFEKPLALAFSDIVGSTQFFGLVLQIPARHIQANSITEYQIKSLVLAYIAAPRRQG